MIKLAKKLLVILIVSIFMISVMTATAYATGTVTEKNIVEYKEKKLTTFKIKWDANGGKIGSKKTVSTSLKKGAKVKLVKTPKRTGYTFEGWYAQKNSGKKITKNTKPLKSTTYFAKWKKLRSLTVTEKKLAGSWILGTTVGTSYDTWGNYLQTSGAGSMYIFKSDGTFSYGFRLAFAYPALVGYKNGTWHVSGDTIYLNNQKGQQSSDGGKTWKLWPIDSKDNFKYQVGTDIGGEYFQYVINNAGDFTSKYRKS